MHKRKRGTKFSREASPRAALLRSLVRSFILKGKIQTTEAKAKETARLAERLITKGKTGTVTARRYAGGYLDAKGVKKLVDELAPQYKERNGGYTRVIKLGRRNSDGAKMAIIEFVQ